MAFHARLATILVGAGVLVALSATTGAVAASMITSKDIEDGTIQSRDLDKQLNASLHKGATALRSVPKNAVTSATVRDGSLRLRDLLTASRTQGFKPQVFRDGQCTTLPVDTGHATGGARAVVFTQTSLGYGFTISGAPDASKSTSIDITVCNNSGVDYAADGANGDTYSWQLYGY